MWENIGITICIGLIVFLIGYFIVRTIWWHKVDKNNYNEKYWIVESYNVVDTRISIDRLVLKRKYWWLASRDMFSENTLYLVFKDRDNKKISTYSKNIADNKDWLINERKGTQEELKRFLTAFKVPLHEITKEDLQTIFNIEILRLIDSNTREQMISELSVKELMLMNGRVD